MNSFDLVDGSVRQTIIAPNFPANDAAWKAYEANQLLILVQAVLVRHMERCQGCSECRPKLGRVA